MNLEPDINKYSDRSLHQFLRLTVTERDTEEDIISFKLFANARIFKHALCDIISAQASWVIVVHRAFFNKPKRLHAPITINFKSINVHTVYINR